MVRNIILLKVDDTHNPPTSRGNCDMSYNGNFALISEKT